MSKWIMALSIAIACAACVPLPVPRPKTTAFRLRGNTVDATTHTAIAGAKISYEGRDDLAFYSDSEGRFDIPAQSDLVLLTVVTVDPVYEYPTPRRMPRAVKITRRGYAPHTIHLQRYYLQKWQEQKPPYFGPAFIIELGQVEMYARADDAPSGASD